MELYRTETYKQLQVLNLLEIVMVSRGDHRREQQSVLRRMKTDSRCLSLIRRSIFIVGGWWRNRISQALTRNGKQRTTASSTTSRWLESGGRPTTHLGSSIPVFPPVRFALTSNPIFVCVEREWTRSLSMNISSRLFQSPRTLKQQNQGRHALTKYPYGSLDEPSI